MKLGTISERPHHRTHGLGCHIAHRSSSSSSCCNGTASVPLILPLKRRKRRRRRIDAEEDTIRWTNHARIRRTEEIEFGEYDIRSWRSRRCPCQQLEETLWNMPSDEDGHHLDPPRSRQPRRWRQPERLSGRSARSRVRPMFIIIFIDFRHDSNPCHYLGH